MKITTERKVGGLILKKVSAGKFLILAFNNSAPYNRGKNHVFFLQ
jgi:hypothetical protein